MEETDDPGGQLEHLRKTLQWLEDIGGSSKAWIFGNIAPGSKHCNSKWAERYNTIIERYQGLVIYQQFGHSDMEYFQL